MQKLILKSDNLRQIIKEEIKNILPLNEFKEVEKGVDDIIKSDDEVKAVLKGHRGSHATKLAREYEELHKKAKEIKKKEKKLKKNIREYITENLDEYLDSKEVIVRRIVETNSVILKVGKQSQRSRTKFNADGFFEDMLELVPELSDKLEELKDKHTTITNYVASGRISTKIKEHNLNEAGIKDLLKKVTMKLKGIFNKFLSKIKQWSGLYDRKLNNIKNKYDIR